MQDGGNLADQGLTHCQMYESVLEGSRPATALSNLCRKALGGLLMCLTSNDVSVDCRVLSCTQCGEGFDSHLGMLEEPTTVLDWSITQVSMSKAWCGIQYCGHDRLGLTGKLKGQHRHQKRTNKRRALRRWKVSNCQRHRKQGEIGEPEPRKGWTLQVSWRCLGRTGVEFCLVSHKSFFTGRGFDRKIYASLLRTFFPTQCWEEGYGRV